MPLPLPLPLLLLSLLHSLSLPTLAQKAGTFSNGGNTQVSAMMMLVGNSQKVYILDKAEGNSASISGHPAWGSVWDIATHQSTILDVRTNTFCSSGMHLPNGSFVTLGGNGAVTKGGNKGSLLNPGGFSASWDAVYQDFDGTKAIRILNPCTDADDMTSVGCTWYDDPTVLAMQKQRWYSAAEPTGTGEVVIIGGFQNGGYVNRNVPNTNPAGDGAECTYEFYPPRDGFDPPLLQFLVDTSGLNAYAHTFLMADGRMFLQANLSTILWDYNTNTETPLPPMPNGVVRVYPASGAVAMLPLSPSNNYTQTILFCGGSNMPADAYGDYASPAGNTWSFPASTDCQRITPLPSDGSAAVYEADDDMLEGRTMGQFIILPDGKLLVVNGGSNGTAGYAPTTHLITDPSQMPFGQSLASGPIGTPGIYDPLAPPGSRWSNAGFDTSKIARLYHSSAILLPDASVLIAGSNPNLDVNTSTVYPTTYTAEIFYPPYFSSPFRPSPQNVPSTISYGGAPFQLLLPASSYAGPANAAAQNTTVVLHRPGFTTHAMNMGQRLLQLNSTYAVQANGSIVLNVAQAPPNPNLFQPGPAFLYVVVGGVPSNGSYVVVGSGEIGVQPVAAVVGLPDNVELDGVGGTAGGSGGNSTASSNGSGGNANGGSTNGGKTTSHTAVIAGVVGSIAGLLVLGSLIFLFLRRRNNNHNHTTIPTAPSPSSYPMTQRAGAAGGMESDALNASATSLHEHEGFQVPYRDQVNASGSLRGSVATADDAFYSREPLRVRDGV